jgi:4-aminobutyrate aminotransferase/(S)-3-amino-2-methylpropionate transaminase
LHFANENGLILISAGVNGNYIRILSPLVITDEQLYRGFDIIERAFDSLV